MGSPEFAVPSLAALDACGVEFAAVYTQPPRRAGRRGLTTQKTPVHAYALRLGVPVYTPTSLKPIEEQKRFSALGVDVAVVVAYGLLLPAAILAAPAYGCLNLHASLLPRWRGAAPIQRAIMAGDTETGVMVMRMEEGLDTGPVALLERTPVGINETAGAIHDRLMGLGADLMVRAISALERDALVFSPQARDGITYAHKIEKSETAINWSQTAQGVHDHIRALAPTPGAWFSLPTRKGDKTERVKVLGTVLADAQGAPGEVLDDALTIACAAGAVRLTRVQRAGRAPVDAEEFLRGNPVATGTRFASACENP